MARSCGDYRICQTIESVSDSARSGPLFTSIGGPASDRTPWTARKGIVQLTEAILVLAVETAPDGKSIPTSDLPRRQRCSC